MHKYRFRKLKLNDIVEDHFPYIPKGTGDLSRRCKIANHEKADYFVSIHCDGVDGMSAKGAHAIYYKGDKEVKETTWDNPKYGTTKWTGI